MSSTHAYCGVENSGSARRKVDASQASQDWRVGFVDDRKIRRWAPSETHMDCCTYISKTTIVHTARKWNTVTTTRHTKAT